MVDLKKVDEKKTPKYKLKKEDIHKLINYATKVPSAAKEAKRRIRNRIAGAITAAFAFVIALVWRDVIRDAVDQITKRAGLEGTGYIYALITALFVTVICVIGIMIFSRWEDKKWQNAHTAEEN